MGGHLTPIKAILKRCLDCSGNMDGVKNCECFLDNGTIKICFLYPYRIGRRPKIKAELTSVKSIRLHCLWCCCGSFALVRDCSVTDCPLWKYRMGKNPARKGIGKKDKMPLESEKAIA